MGKAAAVNTFTCISCGYDLAGVSDTRALVNGLPAVAPRPRCPECGLEVRISRERLIEQLFGIEVLVTIRIGAIVRLWSLALLCFAPLVGLPLWFGGSSVLPEISVAAAVLVFVGMMGGSVGWWLLVTPPVHAKSPHWLAMLVRVVSALHIAVIIAFPVVLVIDAFVSLPRIFSLSYGFAGLTFVPLMIVATSCVRHALGLLWLAHIGTFVPNSSIAMLSTISLLLLVIGSGFAVGMFWSDSSMLCFALPLWLLSLAAHYTSVLTLLNAIDWSERRK